MENVIPFPKKNDSDTSKDKNNKRFNEPNLSPEEAGGMFQGPDGVWQCKEELNCAAHNDGTHPEQSKENE